MRPKYAAVTLALTRGRRETERVTAPFFHLRGDLTCKHRYLVGMDPHDDLLDRLTICEQQVWEALVSGDRQADDDALAAEFLGVYSDGFSAKADHVGQLSNGPTVQSYQLTDLRVLPLGPDHAVLSYRATFQRAGCDAPEAMYVSSIWRRMPEGWLNVFSQDTPASD